MASLMYKLHEGPIRSQLVTGLCSVPENAIDRDNTLEVKIVTSLPKTCAEKFYAFVTNWIKTALQSPFQLG